MKHLFALALCGLLIVSGLTLTACGQPEKTGKTDVAVTEAPQKTTAGLAPSTVSEPATTGSRILYGADEKTRIEALLNSEALAGKISMMKESAANSGYDLTVKAETNKIVFSYVAQGVVDIESAKVIQKNISENSEPLVALAQDMRDKMNIRNAMVQVIILSPDYKTLSDQSYYPAANEAQIPTTAAVNDTDEQTEEDGLADEEQIQ